METPHDLDPGMLQSKNLGKCTKVHADLGPEVDGCPLFDNQNPRNMFCGACGCHRRFHVRDLWNDDSIVALDPKHKIFVSHSGKQQHQKDFVEQLCVDLERLDRYAFFDRDQDCLPIGENFPRLIFRAIHQCHVGVVILSDEFFTSKWPMMELVAMVDEVLERESSFKIIPVFLYSSLDDIRDGAPKRMKWRSLWEGWALKNPERINVIKLEAALKYLRPINGLKGVEYDRLGGVQFRRVIVAAICRAVLPEIKLEVSHIQGSSRLCEVIRDKIVDVQQKGKCNAVCKVGLYGMGGIGKTSLCKVLYNEFFTEFQGRVCHAELGRRSEEELLRHVLERLTDTNAKLLDGRNVDELQDLLKRGIGKHPVFLALDNVSDTVASMKEAEQYLSQSLMPGSIVMVAARSLSSLTRLMDESNCLEMPELEVEEARSLFTKSSKFDWSNGVYEETIGRCVERCRFRKDDGSESYQYHPLALDVLGRQLRGINPEECEVQLDKIDEDIFNRLRENDHPIFSILRKSYDSLSPEDQLLFMDVALFLPEEDRYGYACNPFEWLRMVAGFANVDEVMRRLERLKGKSLLESLGDGMKSKIGMHDLWRAFCVAETENGSLGCRRWVYESKNASELVGAWPNGSCWENVTRMALNCGLKSLEKVNFAHFRNVKVLKLSGQRSKEVVLDVSKLIHLKSLEVRGDDPCGFDLEGLGKDLIFLSSIHLGPYSFGGSRGKLMAQIWDLEELQCLQLTGYGGSKLPDVSWMVSLQFAIYRGCGNVDTLTGLSLKLTNLRVLVLQGCRNLSSCPGVDDLVALEELNCSGCERLEMLPNLQKLTNLRKLDLSRCKLIDEVRGLGDLVALEEFYADMAMFQERTLLTLPNMRKLTKLQVLELGGRYLVAVPGFDSLISLREVVADFREVVERPNLRQLTKLQKLVIRGWSLAGLRGLDNLVTLRSLCMAYCSGVDELPDWRHMISLRTVTIEECEFKYISGLNNLSALESLAIRRCWKLKRLPDLQSLIGLKVLEIRDCAVLEDWDRTLGQIQGSSRQLDNISVGELTGSPPSILSPCGLAGMTSIRAFSQLERLNCQHVAVKELPDLSNFPRLKNLRLDSCYNLELLTSSEPISRLSGLVLFSCWNLAGLPNLRMFPALESIKLGGCCKLRMLSSGEPLPALIRVEIRECNELEALPDLRMFPALETILLESCSMLRMLSSGEPLPALSKVWIKECNELEALPNLRMFPALESIELGGCCKLRMLSSGEPLPALIRVEIRECNELEALPDLRMFPALEAILLESCSMLRMLSSGEPLPALSEVEIRQCNELEALPDLRMFPALEAIWLRSCSKLRMLSSTEPLPALIRVRILECNELEALPDLRMFPALESIELGGCCKLRMLSSGEPLPALIRVEIRECNELEALPDLRMFPALELIRLQSCSKVRMLSSGEPLPALSVVGIRECNELEALPDLRMFPALKSIWLQSCGKLGMLSSGEPLPALIRVEIRECNELEALPDLRMFPALELIRLQSCSKVRMLSSGEPLPALSGVWINQCNELKALPDLRMFPALESIWLQSCGKLGMLCSGEPLPALMRVEIRECNELEALPDLRMFPALKSIELDRCRKLRMLSDEENGIIRRVRRRIVGPVLGT